VVITSGLTTVASILSFMTMDVRPMQSFGLFTAIGIFSTLVLSLSFVPAVIRIADSMFKGEVQATNAGIELLRVWTVSIARWSALHRARIGVGLLLVAIVCAGLISRLKTGVDMQTFFNAGSPPDLAEKFMQRYFGGSQFVQIAVKGDANDPHLLREVRRIANEVSMLPKVTSVSHVGDALALSNSAMTGAQRIPDTTEQVRLLYSFIEHEPAVGQLVRPDRSELLIHVRVEAAVAAEVERVVAAIEQLLASGAIESYRISKATKANALRLRSVVLTQLRVLAQQHRWVVPEERWLGHVPGALMRVPQNLDLDALTKRVEHFLLSKENAVPMSESSARSTALALVELGEGADDVQILDRLRRLFPTWDEITLEDLMFSAVGPVEEAWQQQRASQHAADVVGAMGLSRLSDAVTSKVEATMFDLYSPTAMLPSDAADARTATYAVSGLPVMRRGLSRSVKRNQLVSMGSALLLVLVIMSVVFRSGLVGLIATVPTLLTLLVVYGGMAVMGVHLDIGTSMLASLILGAGVDYSVHLLSAAREDGSGDVAKAVSRSGPAIWINAIMVAAGFLVLTLGDARPLRNVGGLTAAAMLIAAIATFALLASVGPKVVARSARRS